ncbi:MAG: hypothetical protein ACRCXB_17055 [Aeromonadaceae bacterium]
MDKMREEFDAWAEKQGYITERYADDDGYVFADTDECWNSWKASRAALCVELPDSWMEHNDAVCGLAELTEQLDKAGVTYK